MYGIKHGYYPVKDWMQAGKIDCILDSWADVFNAIAKVYVN